MQVFQRGRNFSMRKRVPKRYRTIEPRADVVVSLHTDSLTAARMKAEAVWAEMVEGWEARLAMSGGDATARFESAREIAQRRGFAYVPLAKLPEVDQEEFQRRVEAIGGTEFDPDPVEAEALLGAVEPPSLTVNEALKTYWALAADRIVGKSPDQIRRWENPRKKAVKNFVGVVGNLPLNKLKRAEFLAFREWQIAKVQDGKITAGSANKDIIHLGDVLRTVDELRGLGLDFPMHRLTLKEGEAKKRPPFSREWIETRLLKPGALDGMNAEASGILRMMVNTGARPSEICNLTGETIHLNCEVPHISIEPDGRQLKSRNARRIIPLLGVSLEAAKGHAQGFPRYRASPATLSAAVASYLEENRLLESPAHSLYSLRHGFEDRMLAAGVDERVRRDIMGHALGRQRYGKGASLAHAVELLAPVSI